MPTTFEPPCLKLASGKIPLEMLADEQITREQKHQLDIFYREHLITAEKLTELLQGENGVAASFPYVHALKGAAGALAIEPLFRYCCDFPRQPDRENKVELDRINNCLQQTLTLLAGYVSSTDRTEEELFQQLVQQHNFRAVKMVRAWNDKSSPYPADTLHQLKQHLEQFDFQSALHLIEHK